MLIKFMYIYYVIKNILCLRRYLDLFTKDHGWTEGGLIRERHQLSWIPALEGPHCRLPQCSVPSPSFYTEQSSKPYLIIAGMVFIMFQLYAKLYNLVEFFPKSLITPVKWSCLGDFIHPFFKIDLCFFYCRTIKIMQKETPISINNISDFLLFGWRGNSKSYTLD